MLKLKHYSAALLLVAVTASAQTQHSGIHKAIESGINQQCNLDLGITVKDYWIATSHGINGPVYSVKCPTVSQCESKTLTTSFTIPHDRKNGDPMDCSEVSRFEAELTETTLKVRTCDNHNLCGDWVEVVLNK